MAATSPTGSLDLIVTCPGCKANNRVHLDRLASSPQCGQCHRPLPAPSRPVALDDDTFDDFVSKAALPVVVDFWAAWCGPCKAFAPTLSQFAQEHGGKVLVAKVDVDRAKKTAARYQISSIPTLTLMRSGREVARTVGALTLPQLEAFART